MTAISSYHFRDAHFRIKSDKIDLIKQEIKHQRKILERFIEKYPEFKNSLVPLEIRGKQPEVVRRMQRASLKTGIGPMAAVAGTMAALAGERALAAGSPEVIVENGGDIFLFCQCKSWIGLWGGPALFKNRLALEIPPLEKPLALCSSSSKMGHSLSLGNCDLATVVSEDASLADAAATLACNLVKEEKDIQPALEKIMTIEGIKGLLIIKNDRLGLCGDFPSLVKNLDTQSREKISRDPLSLFET